MVLAGCNKEISGDSKRGLVGQMQRQSTISAAAPSLTDLTAKVNELEKSVQSLQSEIDTDTRAGADCIMQGVELVIEDDANRCYGVCDQDQCGEEKFANFGMYLKYYVDNPVDSRDEAFNAVGKNVFMCCKDMSFDTPRFSMRGKARWLPVIGWQLIIYSDTRLTECKIPTGWDVRREFTLDLPRGNWNKLFNTYNYKINLAKNDNDLRNLLDFEINEGNVVEHPWFSLVCTDEFGQEGSSNNYLRFYPLKE